MKDIVTLAKHGRDQRTEGPFGRRGGTQLISRHRLDSEYLCEASQIAVQLKSNPSKAVLDASESSNTSQTISESPVLEVCKVFHDLGGGVV
jgi:hypothetical protein